MGEAELQAQVPAVYYLGNPHVKEYAPKTKEPQAEYDRLLVRFAGGVHRLDIPDPDVEWAVSKKAAMIGVDQHGTLDV